MHMNYLERVRQYRGNGATEPQLLRIDLHLKAN
jgi:hypothetical protein